MQSSQLDAQFIEALRQRVNPANGTSQLFKDFVRYVDQRLEMGQLEYGDDSFSKPAPFLAQEIEQEHWDIPAWTFILSKSDALSADQLKELLDLCAEQFSLWVRFRRVAQSLPQMNCHVSQTFPALVPSVPDATGFPH